MEKNNNGFVPLTECELEETNGGFGDPVTAAIIGGAIALGTFVYNKVEEYYYIAPPTKS